MNKLRPDSLRPGDMWCGYDKNPWILISGKKSTDPHFPGLMTWELTWFGRKDTDKFEIIVKSWTFDSMFQLVSRAGE